MRPRAYRPFWLLLLAGWALGLMALAGVVSSVFAAAGGGLLIAAGVLLLADGGPIMAALNERYALRARRGNGPSSGASHRVMGPLLIAIGALWVVYGLA